MVCESLMSAVGSPTLEQYRPQLFAGNVRRDRSHPNHYWWLTYDWTNFQILCPVCNRYKANLFPIKGKRARVGTSGQKLEAELPLILNPFDDDPSEHFEYSKSGEILANLRPRVNHD